MKIASRVCSTIVVLLGTVSGSAAAVDVFFQVCAGINVPNACGVTFPPIPESRSDASCPAPGTRQPVVRSYEHLSSRCNYAGVTFTISSSNTTLDCANQLLYFQGDGDGKAAIDILGETDEPITNVTIRNCYIAGYHQGIAIHRTNTKQEKDEQYGLYTDSGETAASRYVHLMASDDKLRQRAPHNIRLENVHVGCTVHEGIYVYNHVTNVSMQNVSVASTRKGPGIYLDSGSRHIQVHDSCVAGSQREGIAVDSSAFNVISKSRFANNGNGGVLLYKNAGECTVDVSGDCHKRLLPRTQHSEGNLIEDNIFLNETKAVWVASRASKDYFGNDLTHGDPIALEHIPEPGDYRAYRYYRDYAERTTIRRNEFRDTRADAVVIEDDHALVADNIFYGGFPYSSDIYLGSRVREWLGDPVYGTEIRGNKFVRGSQPVARLPIGQEYCTTGSIIDRNVLSVFDETSIVDRRDKTCGDDLKKFRLLHPALIGVSVF